MGTRKGKFGNCYFLPNMITELWRIRQVEGGQNFYGKIKKFLQNF